MDDSTRACTSSASMNCVANNFGMEGYFSPKEGEVLESRFVDDVRRHKRIQPDLLNTHGRQYRQSTSLANWITPLYLIVVLIAESLSSAPTYIQDDEHVPKQVHGRKPGYFVFLRSKSGHR